MKKKIGLCSLLVVFVSIIIYSCHKDNGKIKDEKTDNTEVVLYKNETIKASFDKSNIFSGNTRMATKIGYSNSVLNSLRDSDEWTELIATNKIDVKNIIRTTHINTTIELITIPILSSNSEEEDYFNIYIRKDRFLITKAKSSHLSNGNTKVAIESIDDGRLFCQVEITKENKLGNWKFGSTEIPFLEKLAPEKLSKVKVDAKGAGIITNAEPLPNRCSELPYTECMRCLIVDVCGSSWWCIAECVVFPTACLGTMTLMCVIGL